MPSTLLDATTTYTRRYGELKKEMIDRTEIQLSKSKLFLMVVGSAAFVGLGAWFVLNPSEIEPSQRTLIRIIGVVSILFFGACLIFITRKMFDQKIGLVIDKDGITDNSNGTSVGLINWEDITEIGTAEVASTKFILIGTTNSNKYINKATNEISKRAMRANTKMYGTPLSIASNTLKIKHDELLNKIIDSFNIMEKSRTTP